MVFERIREGRALIHFVEEQLPHYTPLVSGDMQRFRQEVMKVSAGVAVAAGAGLIFVVFLSIAVLVSFPAHVQRVVAAWLICGSWGLIALAGLLIARRAVSGPPPFHLVGTALLRDYARFVASLPKEPREPGR
jgi:hypothetical protein